jgi:hypothetical protein
VRENFLGEKTSPYAPVKWPMGAKGSFALNGNHEMYADGNGYWKMVLPRMGLKERGNSGWGAGQWASFFCLENKHWRIIGLDTGYNSTRFDWGKVPVLQRSKWLRKTTWFKPGCTIPEALFAWLKSAVNPDGDKRGLILLSHCCPAKVSGSCSRSSERLSGQSWRSCAPSTKHRGFSVFNPRTSSR